MRMCARRWRKAFSWRWESACWQRFRLLRPPNRARRRPPRTRRPLRSSSGSMTTMRNGSRGPDGLVAKYRDLGLDAVRLTIPWRHGQSRPTHVRVYLHRAAMLIERGQRVVVSVFGRPKDAPVDRLGRSQYCGFLHYILLRIPFHDVAIWNEANSPQFWPSTAGAKAYEELLSACWLRLHRLRADVNVISTTAAHHDPAGFMRALGDAYRASGRRHPIVDTFAHNPYPENAAEPPWMQHEDPRPSARGTSTVSSTPSRTGSAVRVSGCRERAERRSGTSRRDSRRPCRGRRSGTTPARRPTPSSFRRWRRRTQSRGCATRPVSSTNALLLARCQPSVGAFFNFELLDEIGSRAGSPACSGGTEARNRRTTRSRMPWRWCGQGASTARRSRGRRRSAPAGKATSVRPRGPVAVSGWTAARCAAGSR
jgi:hypothetical protein